MRTEDLLTQSQSLARQLQSRGEELQKTNEELQEKARLLAHQNMEVERKNEEVEQARKALEEKAEQLALTSKYKSEFLANMSHELRTPLNSLLILSDQLSKNSDGNLTGRQTEFAKTIHSSGTDLLMLINDILDLSKIESGTVAVDIGELRLADLRSYVERTFRHVAESKGLDFRIDVDPAVPRSMFTDSKRLQQVIKNLLSNAFKFTQAGGVSLRIARAEAPGGGPALALAVSDTGIGIARDKQQIIFEAFQQADGSTSRKYGGTGLGLAISREIARLLGGEIQLVSAPGQGSTFTLYLPERYTAPAAIGPVVTPTAPRPDPELERPATPPLAEGGRMLAGAPINAIGDDRDSIQPGDRVLLAVENDVAFARLLVEAAQDAGFKALVTGFGATALSLSRQYHPSAITLDISLPDIDGWRVLTHLKSDFATRDIPVTVISTGEDLDRGRRLGAWSVLAKPIETRDALVAAIAGLRAYVQRAERELLLVQEDGALRRELAELLACDAVRITAVPTLEAAVIRLREKSADCLVVGPSVPDDELDARAPALGRDGGEHDVPVIVYGRAGAGPGLEAAVSRLTRQVPLRMVAAPERLLDQCALALHVPLPAMQGRQRQILEDLHHSNAALAGRTALIVDDDIRNIFALTSLLERYEMTIVSAETGRTAIERLEQSPGIEVVLMDVMMPVMDGYETMRAIRQNPRFRNLPIIAVTAKAMKGDRERCIEAGAWDYLAKPVDPDELVALLRAWLVR